MPSLVLCSGGMDSCIALFHTLNRVQNGDTRLGPVHAIVVDYGQRHVNETAAAIHIWYLAERLYKPQMGSLHLLDANDLIPSVGSLLNPLVTVRKYYGGQVDGHDDPAFIPHRNLLLLVTAAMWARFFHATEIITGIRGGFSDCTTQFEQLTQQVLAESDPSFKFHISSPVHIDRAQSLALAKTIPGCWEALSFSLTGFEGTEPPCGACLPCRKRAEGFSLINEPDPLTTRLLKELSGIAQQT